MQILQKICCADGRYHPKQKTIPKVGIMSYFYVKYYFKVRKQFPVCYINKVDPVEKAVYLKFYLMDLKEIKINFKKIENSQTNFIIPTGKYELKYITNESNMNKKDDFILSEGDKFLILKFTWTDDDDQISISDQHDSISINKNKT